MIILPSMLTLAQIKEIEKKVSRKNERFRRKFQKKLINVTEVVNPYGEKLIRVDGDIPTDLPVKNGDRFLFISYEQSRYTHGIHKYPAKFFPELPRWFIRKYSRKGDKVLDPFGGSGTTSIEALLNYRHSVSVDIDPFARFLAKVKTTPLSTEELTYFTEILLHKIPEFGASKQLKEFIPDFPYRDNWFEDFIIKELAYLKKIIFELNAGKDITDFLLIVFSSIIREVSNADNHCTRTVIRKKLKKEIFPSMALTLFTERLLLYRHRMVEFSKKAPTNVSVEIPENSDAKNINYPDAYFDLAVTSPPYVNAVDYPRTHQLEMYWLELTKGSLVELKRKHIGTESVTAKDYKILHKTGIPEADSVIEKIFEKDNRRAYIAYKFLEDMEIHLKEVHRVLKQGGRYVVVIGNNTIRGTLFESWKYLIRIAERNGFSMELYFGSEIIKHFIKIKREERINTDWIIVLRK